MHLLTAFSLKNRALIALVTIVAALFGFIGVGSLKQELMPSVQFPAIAVVTNYPGASPEVVNKDVSGPIETAMRGVPQLESTTATSSTGASMVVAQFSYGVDLASTEQKVERAISRISKLLPDSADSQVLSGSIDDFPVIQIAVTPADGQTPEETAQTIERVAIPELSDLAGVRDAQLSGARGERITITPRAEELAAQGLTAQSIADTLQQSGVLLAAGTVTDGDQTLAVQAGSQLHSVEDIAALPLPRSAAEVLARQQALLGGADQGAGMLAGQTQLSQTPEVAPTAPAAVVTIGDVADVTLEPGPETSISRVDGAPALTIGVTKMSAANTVEVSHAVQDKLESLQDQLDGAKLSIVFDQAPYIEQSIHTLTTEGLLGLVFAVLVILVFLMSVRATLVTAISIPVSVLLTFIGLNFADYTLNMLTLGALTISIGRVVDDSIVVIENIKRHLGLAPDAPRTATIVTAVREVAGAITASTVTTVAVFLPMAFVGGMVGELFRPFAFTVTIALAASLFVSLTIVPVLAYWFLGSKRRVAVAGDTGAATAGESPAAATAVDPAADHEPDRGISALLTRGYRPIIEWTLKRPVATLLIAVVVLAGTFAATPLMKTSFMGSDEQNSVGLVQTLKPGLSLEAQLAQAERVEKALADVPAVQSVQVTIGNAGGGMASLFGGGGDGAVNYSLTTDPDANQVKAQDDIRAAVDALEDAGDFSIGQSSGGMASSNAIEINVTAPDQKTLAEASKNVADALKEQSGLVQVESDLSTSRPYLSVTVDRQAAADAGLTEAAVAGQVAGLMQPKQIGQITMESDSLAVYLTNGVAPGDEAGVKALPIQTALGSQPLESLASVKVADGPVTVRTEDGTRMVTVSALPKGDDLGTANTEVQAALDSVKLPAGAKANIGGVMSQQSEAFGQLGLALLAAILIVYVVMVATFRSLLQPLLLLVSVPFAATGAIVLLILSGIPLGVASLIGVLMLVGIVVTNAIVLIDLVNQYRSRGDSLREAVLHGTLQRLRPIVMTALATILALTPMGLGITGKGGFISQPLAVVVIGGLLSSTVLTLVVLPTLYFVVERLRERGRRSNGGGDGDGTGGNGDDADGLGDGDGRAGANGGRRASRRLGGGAAMTGGAGALAGVGAGVGVGSGDVLGAGVAARGDAPSAAEGVADASPAPEPRVMPSRAIAFNDLLGLDGAAPSRSRQDAEAVEPAVVSAGRAEVPAVAALDEAPAVDPVEIPTEAAESAWLPAPDQAPAPAPAQTPDPALAEDRTEPRAQEAPAAAETLAPLVLPIPETFAASDTGDSGVAAEHEMGPATAQMSLALSALGFSGSDNPLPEIDEEARPAGEAGAEAPRDDDASLAGASGAFVSGEADEVTESLRRTRHAQTDETQTQLQEELPSQDASFAQPVTQGPETLPARDELQTTEVTDTREDTSAQWPDVVFEPVPTEAEESEPQLRRSTFHAAPATGELDWEQLMWQAAQEVAEESAEAAPRVAHSATDAAASDSDTADLAAGSASHADRAGSADDEADTQDGLGRRG